MGDIVAGKKKASALLMLLIAPKLSFRCSFKMSPSLLVVAVQVNQLCQLLPANDGVNLTAS
jgi:hypothetical protein